MLNRIRIPRVAVLVALVVAMTFAVSDAAPKAPAGKITYLKGSVEAFSGGAWAKLKKGDKIKAAYLAELDREDWFKLRMANDDLKKAAERQAG